MILVGGTSGFQYGQVVFEIHLSVGQVDFLTKFEPCLGRKEILDTKNNEFNRAAIFVLLKFIYLQFSINREGSLPGPG